MQDSSPVDQALVGHVFYVLLTACILGGVTVLIARHKKDKRVLLWFGAGLILGPIGWILALIFAKPDAGET